MSTPRGGQRIRLRINLVRSKPKLERHVVVLTRDSMSSLEVASALCMSSLRQCSTINLNMESTEAVQTSPIFQERVQMPLSRFQLM